MTENLNLGQLAPAERLVNIPQLMTQYYSLKPDTDIAEQRVKFGTSGHRGNSSKCSFNESHILAITQAICDYRMEQRIIGPLYLGKDTHALSEAAYVSCLQVLVANGVNVIVQENNGYTPTPVISHAILMANSNNKDNLADGIIITPSHNPPQDGGIKYNPPHGGPADSSVTQTIENRANDILSAKLDGVVSLDYKYTKSKVTEVDFRNEYVDQLDQVINMRAIADANIKIGVDPLGGSGIHYWPMIAEKYGIEIDVINNRVDPQFAFMPLDKDGEIRMDCSSPYAMAGLIAMKDKYDISIGNDPDYDRHGIVTKSAGLMNPNHFLAVAIDYLCRNRPQWPDTAAIGKTLVSSSMINRVVASHNRILQEVPVGFKWFVDGLKSSTTAFAGEESAGASFLRLDGNVWTTDKDGIILALLAAEILATTGKDPALLYRDLENKFGSPLYTRTDESANHQEKEILSQLSDSDITATELAGDKITNVYTTASGNNQAIGGVKVETRNGWFAARPSGTENKYKIYCESFLGEEHLKAIELESKQIISRALKA